MEHVGTQENDLDRIEDPLVVDPQVDLIAGARRS
jgi:hypothetical protein